MADISKIKTLDGTTYNIKDATARATANAAAVCKRFTNVSVSASAWASNTTYSDYGYRASVALSGITADFFVEVIFSPNQISAYNPAPICESYAGGVYIYAETAPEEAITIPSIVGIK